MQFENDIFISYAHIDDQSLIEGQNGWVSNLHRVLQVRVAQLLGKTPKIWRDPKLQGNDVFGDELVQSLPKTAILLSVLSPRYAQSEWCQRELSEFYDAAARAGGVRLGNKSRVFKVVKTPVPLEQQPPDFREVLGYEFYVVDEETGRPHELDQAFGSDAQRKYWAKLDDLAYDITEMLGKIAENGGGGVAAANAAGPAEGKTVYVAKTGFDLNEQRDELVRDLQRRGHEVLPDQQLPLYADGIEAYLQEALPRCQLSVHLIGKSYGLIPEGATRSVLELQNDLAIEHARAGDLARFIWMPPDLQVEDERQRALVEHLHTDTPTHEGADLLLVPLEDLKSAIQESLEAEEPEEEEAAGGEDVENGAASIYLLCDQRDADSVLDFGDYLYDQGLEVTLPVFEGNETEIREDHEANLRDCQAAIIYYGGANDLWLRRQLRELRKSPGYGRSGPIPVRAVYVAPPETPQKRRFRTREASVIRGSSSFDPADLENLLQELGDQT